jgi:hypothetical protein
MLVDRVIVSHFSSPQPLPMQGWLEGAVHRHSTVWGACISTPVCPGLNLQSVSCVVCVCFQQGRQLSACRRGAAVQ